MNDLQLDLTGAADTVDVPPGDVHAVVARGRARAQRRRRLVATAAAMALVGTSVAGLRLIAAGEPTTTLAAGGSAMRLDEGLVTWETVEGASVLSLIRNPTTTSPSGRLYALSTAPGEADLDQPLPRVVWQSDDGVDWAAAPLSDDIFLSDLAASDERIYAVGTGPATAAVAGGRAVPEVVVGWSDDGADNWQTATLDIDLPAIAEASRNVSVGEGLAVATTPAGTVATVSVYADLDLPRFLPEGVTAPNGWTVTPAGVDLLGPFAGCPEGTTSPAFMEGPAGANEPNRIWSDQCMTEDGEINVAPQEVRGVIESFTWDELGVSGDLRRAALWQPMAFVAAPGSTDFQRVELPADGIGGGGVALHGDGEGFLLVVPGSTPPGSRPAMTVLESSDGRSWAEADTLPGALSWIQAAGRVGETFVLLGTDLSGEGVVATDTGGEWSTVSLNDLLGVEGSVPGFGSAAVGPEGVVAVVYGIGDEPAHLLTSGDAVTWSDEPVADLIGEPVASVGQPVITGDRAVVPVAPDRPRDPDEHLTQVALVATLP